MGRIESLLGGILSVVIAIPMYNFVSGNYSKLAAYEKMEDATPIVRDIDSDGLADIVLQGKDGKPVMAFVNKDGKYISLKEYMAQQEASQKNEFQEKYQEYLK